MNYEDLIKWRVEVANTNKNIIEVDKFMGMKVYIDYRLQENEWVIVCGENAFKEFSKSLDHVNVKMEDKK